MLPPRPVADGPPTGGRRFVPTGTGYAQRVTDLEDTSPSGPANPHSSAGPDAPTAPGGPQRTDAADATTSPTEGGEPPTPPEPEVHPSSTPDGPPTIPVPASRTEPTADGEIHAATQTDQVNEELQQENAETSLDQPSDGSGGE